MNRTHPCPARGCLAAAVAQALIGVAQAAPAVSRSPQEQVQVQQQPQVGVTLQGRHAPTPLAPNHPLTPRSPLPNPVIQPPHGSPQQALRRHKSRGSGLSRDRAHLLPIQPEPPRLTLKLEYVLHAYPIPTEPGQTTPTRPPAWLIEIGNLLGRDESGQPAQELGMWVENHHDELVALHDADLAQRLGWWATRHALWDKAVFWFRRSLADKPGQNDVRYGLALALRESGQLEDAWVAIAHNDDPKSRRLRADLAFDMAQVAQKRQDHEAQIRWLRQAIANGRDDQVIKSMLAWAYYRQGNNRQAADSFADLYANHPDAESAAGLYYSLQALGQSAEIERLAARGGPFAALARRRRVQELLDFGMPHAAASLEPPDMPLLSGLLEPSLRLGPAQRDKSGSSGSSQLQIRRMPDLSLRWPQSAQTWDFDLARVRLDAGPVTPATPIGSAVVGQPPVSTRIDAGWEMRLRWNREGPDSWSASLGLTPSDGPVSTTVTGSLDWQRSASGHAYTLRAYAEPVRDSILSYVGLRDPASGQEWGRVLRYGMGAQGYTALSASGWNASGSLALEHLSGHKVAGNTHLAAAAGIGRNLAVPGMRFFSIGPGISYERYARNLSAFTWGHGGYFSPQDFASVGLNLLFQTEDAKRFVARGQASAGWQAVRQAAAPCFPLVPPLVTPHPACSSIDASNSTGLSTSAELSWAYLLSPHWTIEGSLGWRTGPAYRDHAFYLGLRYNLGARSALFGADLPPTLRKLW